MPIFTFLIDANIAKEHLFHIYGTVLAAMKHFLRQETELKLVMTNSYSSV